MFTVHTYTTIELAVMIALFIPTLYAMISGAPFVPTPMAQVRRMLNAVPLKAGMVLYDLGSGDGRLVHTAAREHHVKAIGYELSPIVWLWSQAIGIFWRSKGKLRLGNFWNQNLKDADVVVCYLLPKTMSNVQKNLFSQFKPGTFIISNSFAIEGLTPWKEIPRDREQKLGPVWIYKI